MTTLLGVDAGASHTTAAVADEHGTVLVRQDGGPGAVRPGSAQAAAEAIVETCREALRKAFREERGDVLVAGAAGAGREEERLALEAALEGTGIAPRVLVTTDAAVALRAAFGEAPGIVVVAGTGSVAWARLPGGSTVRVGGLGAMLGDQGSGYDIGRQGLRAVGLSIEGRGAATALGELVLKRLHLPGLTELVRWSLAADVSAVAALAPVVLEAAAAGDATSGAVVDAAADELARHVRALATHFPDRARIRVALGGSLLTRSAEYRQRVVARIVAEVTAADIVTEPVDPVLGAVQLARSLIR
jgi:N-acetylglucosamine kinase-like BadF-type ATPase